MRASITHKWRPVGDNGYSFKKNQSTVVVFGTLKWSDGLDFTGILEKPVEAVFLTSTLVQDERLQRPSKQTQEDAKTKGKEEMKVLWSCGENVARGHSASTPSPAPPPSIELATSNTHTKDRKHGSDAGMLSYLATLFTNRCGSLPTSLSRRHIGVRWGVYAHVWGVLDTHGSDIQRARLGVLKPWWKQSQNQLTKTIQRKD